MWFTGPSLSSCWLRKSRTDRYLHMKLGQFQTRTTFNLFYNPANKIIHPGMSSVLEHYNPYNTNSQLEWDGLRSSKFGRTKVFLPHKDLISTGFNYPNQETPRGKKHYDQRLSPQQQFRSIVKIIPKIEHWHPRESHKKVFSMSFTSPHPRRERGHNVPEFPPTERGTAGIRTFYNTRVRDSNIREYSVEDRMQRKVRVDQLEMRKTLFLREKSVRDKFCL